jgi:hypothetical protein
LLLSLREVRESGALNIAGVCPTSKEFTRLVNEATSRIMRRGDWSGTVLPIYVCVRAGCVVFPRYVLNVRKMNQCCSMVPIRNNWYEFMPNDSMWRRNSYDSWADFSYAGGPRCAMVGQTQTPVFQDILGEGRLLQAHIRYQNDIGKTMRVFGVDNNGQALMEKVDGVWVQGITLTFATPYVRSEIFVRSIERVLKDETEGPVNLYAYNADNDVLEEIAQYDGAETNPSYSKYKLGNWPRPGCCTFPITALVKLRYVPAKNPDDLVLIDNLDALKDMMQAVKLREAGDISGSAQFELSAIRELNLQLDDENPLDQIPIRMGELGGTSIGYQKVF